MDENELIKGRTKKEWILNYPLLNMLIEKTAVFWFNPELKRFDFIKTQLDASLTDLENAEALMHRFSPLIAAKFPETQQNDGIFESDLVSIPHMAQTMQRIGSTRISGDWWVKCDNDLPVVGSIKARGGIYEILAFTEQLLCEKWNWNSTNNYLDLLLEKYQNFFDKYTITTGSTGNLGLSIGLLSKQLGYRSRVYMSNDAKTWKKQMLKDHGIEVIEIEGDYSKAVATARNEAKVDPMCYFIDDEDSIHLFIGYGLAAIYLKKQLQKKAIVVDETHPLCVYLPCGVGSSPGGITFGLKCIFGDNVHCFFAEPVACPSMLLGLLTKKYNEISLEEFGVTVKTEADGLACKYPSRLVAKQIENLVSGIYTVPDADLYALLTLIYETESIKIEPSASISLLGPIHVLQAEEYSHYLQNLHLGDNKSHITHLSWLTGGIFLPDSEFESAVKKGKTSELYRLLISK